MSNQLDATIMKRLDIAVRQNQTFNATITLLDDNNAPINLNGADVKMSVREDSCGCNVGCNNSFDNNFNQVYKQDFIPSIGGGSFNVLQFFDTITLAEGSYKYDILVEYPNTLKQYILGGTFKVKKSFTII